MVSNSTRHASFLIHGNGEKWGVLSKISKEHSVEETERYASHLFDYDI